MENIIQNKLVLDLCLAETGEEIPSNKRSESRTYIFKKASLDDILSLSDIEEIN